MEQENVQNLEDNSKNVETQTTNQNEGAFKVFKTEEEYNKAFNAIKASILPPKEEMDEFKEWKKSQKKEDDELKQNDSELKNTNEKLTQENAVLRAKVSEEFVDFVKFTVSQMSGDFNENLKNYLEKNPKYLEASKLSEQNVATKTTTTGYPQKNNVNSVNKNKAYLDKKYGNNKYYTN